MLVLAHRGRHPGNAQPDNTLGAARGALANGMDGVEVDVRRSRDGHAVLFHDATLPDGRPVAGCTRAEMSRVAGFAVPTLDELVSTCPGAFLDVELKTLAALEPALPALRRADPSRLLVTSFDAATVHAAAAALHAPCGMILERAPRPGETPWRKLLMEKKVRAVVIELMQLDQGVADLVRADRLSLLVWGVSTAADCDRAAALGVDGVIVDG